MMPRRHRNALTLIEVILSTALLSSVVVVTLQACAGVLVQHQTHVERFTACRIVEVFTAEVSSRMWADAEGPAFGGVDNPEVRSTFDDIDDYHDYVQSPPTFSDGQAIEGSDGWTVSIDVQGGTIDVNGAVTMVADSEVDEDTPVRRITLTLISPTSQTYSESFDCSNDRPALADAASCQMAGRVHLQSSNGQVERWTVPLRNFPELP